MTTFLIVSGVWFVLAVVVGLVLGRGEDAVKRGERGEQERAARRRDQQVDEQLERLLGGAA